jgi:hypothetical protein
MATARLLVQIGQDLLCGERQASNDANDKGRKPRQALTNFKPGVSRLSTILKSLQAAAAGQIQRLHERSGSDNARLALPSAINAQSASGESAANEKPRRSRGNTGVRRTPEFPALHWASISSSLMRFVKTLNSAL